MQNTIQVQCPICFLDFSSPQLVYNYCCFQKVCDVCDKILKNCAFCQAELRDLRINFGFNPSDKKNYSQLRLSTGKHTGESIVKTVKQFFPVLETRPTCRLSFRIRKTVLDKKIWCTYLDGEINEKETYFLEYMRLPHMPVSDIEVDSWIFILLCSGKDLTNNPLTIKEIHRKCNIYAARISSIPLSLEYISARLQSLKERNYCIYSENTQTYRYLA